jgi:DNA (cytosine-5)-methyltransferase 1
LLPHFIELVKQCNFQTIFGEQVPGAIKHGWLDDLCLEMEREKYTVGQIVLTAAGEGAPHIRQRLYWVADSNGKQRQQRLQQMEGGQTERIGSNSIDSIMANNINKGLEGRIPRRENTTRETVSGHFGCSGTVDGMENSISNGQRERAEVGGGVFGQHQDWETCNQSERRSEVCRMGNTELHGHDASEIGRSFSESEKEGRMFKSEGSDTVKRLGNTEHDGQSTSKESRSDATPIRHSQTWKNSTSESEGTSTSRIISEWTDPDWIYCRDEKYRPIKSSIEPLANGLPRGMGYSSDPSEPIDANNTQGARVMRLKGYGNAIVPQVASSFIKAFMQC